MKEGLHSNDGQRPRVERRGIARERCALGGGGGVWALCTRARRCTRDVTRGGRHCTTLRRCMDTLHGGLHDGAALHEGSCFAPHRGAAWRHCFARGPFARGLCTEALQRGLCTNVQI